MVSLGDTTRDMESQTGPGEGMDASKNSRTGDNLGWVMTPADFQTARGVKILDDYPAYFYLSWHF